MSDVLRRLPRMIAYGTDYLTEQEIRDAVLCTIIVAQSEPDEQAATRLRALANRLLDQITN